MRFLGLNSKRLNSEVHKQCTLVVAVFAFSLLIGCAAYTQFVQIERQEAPDPESGYIYGNFQPDEDLVIWLRNQTTRREYTLKGFRGPEGIYAIQVDPGPINVVMICNAGQGCKDYRTRPHRSFRVVKGAAYYFGDYAGSGPKPAPALFVDNYDKTTEIFREKYPNFSGLKTVNTLKIESEDDEEDEI